MCSSSRTILQRDQLLVTMYANFADNGNQKKENTIKPILIVSSGLHLKLYQEINIFVRLFSLGNIVTTRRTLKQYKLGVRYYFILVTISLESLVIRHFVKIFAYFITLSHDGSVSR